MAMVFVTLLFAGCNMDVGGTVDSEVTDLQLALLNSILYNDTLTQFEGKSIEGHGELINQNYKEHISGGDTLIDQLKGYTLIDYDYGDLTGFKAAAFMKGNSLVIVYCGTDHVTDWGDNIPAALFDFSAQDGQAKEFAKDNAKKQRHDHLFITGYSLGGRLCYLGSEDVIDNDLGNNLKKVRTFNGLGVKEFIDFTDSNLSNIHNLQTKIANKTYNYIVEGDAVSDGGNYFVGYTHVGTDFIVPCTNKADEGLMKQHDLYSVIDYLLNNPPPAEDTGHIENLDSKAVLSFSDEKYNLMGDFVNLKGDVEVKTWNTFVSKYPKVADPMNSGRDYFSKMHLTIFFLKDNEGDVIECKGVMNATGFGNDPCGWKNKYGEFDWMSAGASETYEEETFYILYNGEYYAGPAACSVHLAKLREYVTLGEYEQDGDESTGKEPIEWLVLTQDDEKMFVISRYCLDYLHYPDDNTSNIRWETCSLRKVLNTDFLHQAFSAEEQQNILPTQNPNTASADFYSTIDGNPTEDSVFLMSIEEVQTYLPASSSGGSSKIAYCTDYLYDKLQQQSYLILKNKKDPAQWALRADIDTSRNKEGFGTPREIYCKDQIVSSLSTGAMMNPDGPFSIVRPAMWIKNTVKKHRSNVLKSNDTNSEAKDSSNRSGESATQETTTSETATQEILASEAATQETAGNDADLFDKYYNLIVDNNNVIETNDKYHTIINVRSDTPLALHDFDMDGVPELIIGNPGARLGLEVFTVSDGNVLYAGAIGGKSSFYSTDASYHGIFRSDSWNDTQVLGYTALSGGKLEYREVISGKYNQSTKKFDYSIKDETLYDVYLGCTTSDSDDICTVRIPNNELQLYYWRDIESNGWSSFVKYYGY